MHDALVVADDPTGAADAGDRFAARGYPTVVTRREAAEETRDGSAGSTDGAGAAPGNASVLVVDTDARAAPAATAADRVAATVEAHPARVVYAKIDSTLRGPVAAAVDAAVAASGGDLAVVAPAFPATGRTTVGGYHLVDGTPVDEAVGGPGPGEPADTSYLPARLGSSEHPVEHVPVDVVADGPDAVRAALAAVRDEHGVALVACDATGADHLRAIADGAAALPASPVYVGSAGLAGFVRIDGDGADGACGDRAGRVGVLGVVGSVANATFAQLAAVEDAPDGPRLVALDGAAAVEDPDAAARAAAPAAVEGLEARGCAVVTAATGRGDVDATLAAACEAGVPEAVAAERVADALGRVAGLVREQLIRTRACDGPESADLRGLLLSGGAVAGRALAALDADGLRATGRSVAAGVPLARVDGGPADGTPVVTKAGAFGDDDALVDCLDVLARHAR